MSDIPNHILNLPSEITIDILSRLPIKTIISCKLVCKKWLELLSTPEFAKSHIPRSNPALAVYITQGKEDWCKIVEFEDVQEFQHHDLQYKPVLKFDPKSFMNSPGHSIGMECSVNGLLCLHDLHSELDALHICNPITHEYIPLMKLEGNMGYPNIVTYGFGVGLLSRQYKVVRILHKPAEKGSMPKVECMIYTLGTGFWRKISSIVPYEYNLRSSNGAFLNGCVHWLAGDANGSQLISCLDLETELFKPFPLPPFPSYFPYNASLAVVGDCLWFCDYSSDEEIVIWVMKEYGVEESWVKEVVLSKELGELGGLSNESVYPLKIFKDGAILFLWENTCLFYYSQETETAPKVGGFERGRYGRVEAIPHTSSFVSLRSFPLENVISFL